MTRTQRSRPSPRRRTGPLVEALEVRPMMSVALPQLRVAETTSTTPFVVLGGNGAGTGHLHVVPRLHTANVAAARPGHAASKFHTNLAFDAAIKSSDLTAPATSYTPAQISKAYGFDQLPKVNGQTLDGTGQTIAIIDPYDDPNIELDLAKFDKYFNLPALDGVNGDGTFTKVVSAGGTPQADSAAAFEISLDVEWAHALAPKANIILFESRGFGTDIFKMEAAALRTPNVTVVTNSWGGPEGYGQIAADSLYFKSVPGHSATVLASTGDNGQISYPATAPGVLAVGGTSLYAADDVSSTGAHTTGTYSHETAWGYGALTPYYGGGGGGTSYWETQPANYSYQGSSGVKYPGRSVPDISFDADPATGVAVYDSTPLYDGAGNAYVNWSNVGGTSFSSPAWASIVALANQSRALSGKTPLNGATQTIPELYNLYKTSYANTFHDVTSGNNGYPAHIGYDQATGIGTPKVPQVVAGLAGVPSAATGKLGGSTFSNPLLA